MDTDLDTELAVLMSLIALLLWGSWANTILLTRTRFELYMLDFMVGHIISGLLQVFKAAPIIGHVLAEGWYGASAVGICVVAGVLYAFAMLLSVAACNLAGMALSTVLVLGVEICIGTPLLMFVEAFGTVEHLLFSAGGIVAVLIATLCDFLCHTRLEKDRMSAAPYVTQESRARSSSLSFMSFDVVTNLSTHSLRRPRVSSTLQGMSMGSPRGSNTFLTHSVPIPSLSGHEAPRVVTARCGMLLAGLSGVFFSIWPVASSFVEGQTRAGDVVAKLDPASFFLFYSTSSFLACLILLPVACRNPIHGGNPLAFWPNYLALPAKVHCFALLGGTMHGLGTVLSLESGRVLGNTISVSILRCHPLVVSLWGVFAWEELKGAKLAASLAFVCMLLMFVIAVMMFLCADLLNK